MKIPQIKPAYICIIFMSGKYCLCLKNVEKIILIRISQQLKLAESCTWKTYAMNRVQCLIIKCLNREKRTETYKFNSRNLYSRNWKLFY